ncbi:MAG TPA: CehA/McbA family metallohydrolase [Thermoanaerobaculia bacterium]|jgi:hypothetical protein|nr:CehA/McbA family metallohydrolase [Thermoanaerobaculia bacterium]
MRQRRSASAPLLVVVLLLCAWSFGAERTTTGYLELTVRDARSGEITPARVELLDEKHQVHVPGEALRVAGDCGWFPIHNWIPWAAAWQMRRHLRAGIPNPYTGTTQFYLTRSVRMRVPTGRYSVRAFKGIEYKVANGEAEVWRNETTTLTLPLERWIDMPAEGWYSADDHLHIARPNATFDETIAKWMQAEDVHVANLLQFGLAHSIHLAPQYKFGKPSVYQLGRAMLASGQENPRTHVLGHSITLGASRWLDVPKNYLAYDRVWREARREGGISGFAHWGIGGADEGMAVWIPQRLLDFLEVLGFGLAYYDSWYELLNLGVRMTPTAGSDYPCSDSVPGRERFYTRVRGPLTYALWIDAVRRGHTFITNGPIIDLHVNGVGMGDELDLSEPATVDVEGSVRFDPERDDVMGLELVRAGDVVFSTSERARAGEVRLHLRLPVPESTWLALRARGEKLGETSVVLVDSLKGALTYVDRPSNAELLRRFSQKKGPRPTAAHTAPVYVTVAGTPAIAEQPKASEAARAWSARLDELEALLAEDRLPKLARFPGRGDGLKLNDLRSGRAELLKAIASARAAYHQWPAQSTTPSQQRR